jgi:hypothetical protein
VGFAPLSAEGLDDREVPLSFLGERHPIGLATLR